MLPALLIMVLGCGGCKDDRDGPADRPGDEVCSRPTVDAPIGAADANGDDAVDLADAVAVLRYQAAGGEALACEAGVDFAVDGNAELDDAFILLSYLYESDLARPQDIGCSEPPAVARGSECAPMALAIDAPASTDGESVEATITLDGGGQSVEGWSLSVEAEGCTITRATTDGTDGARTIDDPPGLRDLGYDGTFLAEGGAVSAVVLGFMEPRALADGPRPVLKVTAEGCGTCTLRIGGALTAMGKPVEALAVAGGASWPLPPISRTIEVCAR